MIRDFALSTHNLYSRESKEKDKKKKVFCVYWF